MFKITTIYKNDLLELEDIVNNYALTSPHVVDVDILQHFIKNRLSETSIPKGYIAVIKENILPEEDVNNDR